MGEFGPLWLQSNKVSDLISIALYIMQWSAILRFVKDEKMTLITMLTI